MTSKVSEWTAESHSLSIAWTLLLLCFYLKYFGAKFFISTFLTVQSFLIRRQSVKFHTLNNDKKNQISSIQRPSPYHTSLEQRLVMGLFSLKSMRSCSCLNNFTELILVKSHDFHISKHSSSGIFRLFIFFVCFCCWCLGLVFKTGSQVAQTGLELSK